MAIPAYTNLLNAKDVVDSRTSDSAARVFSAIASKPILDGLLVSAQELDSAVTNPVAHGLGRTPLGWFPVSLNADTTLWETQARDENLLYLACSADVTASFWVF